MSVPPTLPQAAPTDADTTARPTWGETLRVYLEPASLRMFALGFSAGLPLLLVLGTLSFRLREAGLDRTTIGYLSWVGLATASNGAGRLWWTACPFRCSRAGSAGGAAGCCCLRH
jgi:hypothetical protein